MTKTTPNEKATKVLARMAMMLRNTVEADEEYWFHIPDGGMNIELSRAVLERQYRELYAAAKSNPNGEPLAADVVRIAGRHWLGMRCDECHENAIGAIILVGEQTRICENCVTAAHRLLHQSRPH